jgi:cadmium resistance protein CadD (predicted permease)
VFCQTHSNRLFRWFSYMACAMGLFFLIYAKLVPSKAFLLGYLAMLLLGLGTFHALKSRRWFSKHLAYRVLAETMRTLFFLRLTSADRHVSASELIRLAGIDRFDGFAWITNVLKSAEQWTQREPRDQAQEEGYLSLAREAWIDAQKGYFRAKVTRLEHAHRRLARLKTVLICMLVALAVVLVAGGGQLGALIFDLGFSGKDLLLFVMGLLPVWLGIWELYQGKMATRELLWQYRNQLRHFSRATVELTQAGDRLSRVAVLAALGKDSLMESYLWTIHRYHREHEPPAAG